MVRLDLLGEDEYAVLFRAAELGNAAAVELMLDLGFPIEARGDDGGTALHAAAYNGSVEVARLLLARGANLHERDSSWDDNPLGWVFFFQAEDGIRDLYVTGVQTCALPI